MLFVCVHNAGRSQMAAVSSASIGGRSTCALPAVAGEPDQRAVLEVMEEIGVDLGEEFRSR